MKFVTKDSLGLRREYLWLQCFTMDFMSYRIKIMKQPEISIIAIIIKTL